MATFGQDPRLATIASFVESFRRTKALRFQEALETRKENRYERQLQGNLRVNQRTFGLARDREDRLERQFQFERGKPKPNSIEYYTDRGYPPEEAKFILDIKVGAKQRPLDMFMKGLAMRDNAFSGEEENAANQIIREAMRVISAQIGDSSPTTFGEADTPVFEPGTPVSSDLTTGLPQLFTQPEGPPLTAQGTGVFQGPQQEPLTGLEEITDQLTDEERETAEAYIQSGIEPQVIVDWFKQHGDNFQFPKQGRPIGAPPSLRF